MYPISNLIISYSYIEKENKYFYYNNQSKQSQWEHPLDEYYRQIVEKTRFAEDSSTGELNIIFTCLYTVCAL